MAPQQTTTVDLPDTIEPVETKSETGGWVFPSNWSEEDKRDWLVTHPTTPPEVETLNVDPELDNGGENEGPSEPPVSQHYDDCAEECDGDRRETEWTEAQVISALKADGTYAAAIAVPPELAESVNSDNYDPRQFFLVHQEVWNEMVSAVQSEAELGLENKELRKRVNALTRGMRKVNKHWSATKRELKHLEQRHRDATREHMEKRVKIYGAWAEDLKKKDIFATRLARRLRKARAGRDKRERQLNQANQAIQHANVIVDRQDDYIMHLENLVSGGTLSKRGRVEL